ATVTASIGSRLCVPPSARILFIPTTAGSPRSGWVFNYLSITMFILLVTYLIAGRARGCSPCDLGLCFACLFYSRRLRIQLSVSHRLPALKRCSPKRPLFLFRIVFPLVYL